MVGFFLCMRWIPFLLAIAVPPFFSLLNACGPVMTRFYFPPLVFFLHETSTPHLLWVAISKYRACLFVLCGCVGPELHGLRRSVVTLSLIAHIFVFFGFARRNIASIICFFALYMTLSSSASFQATLSADPHFVEGSWFSPPTGEELLAFPHCKRAEGLLLASTTSIPFSLALRLLRRPSTRSWQAAER